MMKKKGRKENLNLIKVEVDRALVSVNHSLNNIMTIASGSKLALKRADLSGLITDAFSLVARTHSEKILKYSLEGEVREMTCHANSMSRLFVNLIDNAFQACDSGNEIIVFTKYSRESVVISS